MKGFDQYNGNPDINYAVAKKEGFDFLIHKASEGYTFTDPKFLARIAQAKNTGLLVGAYCFARPKTGTPEQEVPHLVDLWKQAGCEIAPILDLEDDQTGLSLNELRAWTVRWLTLAAKLSGEKPILYSYPSFIKKYGLADPSVQALCDLWIANYQPAPDLSGFKSALFQQTSDNGTVAGVSPICTDLYNGSSLVKKPAAMAFTMGKTYTVQSGDTLSQIAVDHHTTVAALAALNAIQNPNEIDIGQVLKLSDQASISQSARSLTTSIDTGHIHYVQPGETLSGVGSRYNVPFAIIARWNGIPNANQIQIGQKLVIPRAHRVRAGETLSGLVGSNWPTVARANGLADANRLFVGQTLYI